MTETFELTYTVTFIREAESAEEAMEAIQSDLDEIAFDYVFLY